MGVLFFTARKRCTSTSGHRWSITLIFTTLQRATLSLNRYDPIRGKVELSLSAFSASSQLFGTYSRYFSLPALLQNISCTITHLDGTDSDYVITSDQRAPFDSFTEELAETFQRSSGMVFIYEFDTPVRAAGADITIHWKVLGTYSFNDGPRATYAMDFRTQDNSNRSQSLMALNACLLVVTLVQLLLVIKALRKSWTVYSSTRDSLRAPRGPSKMTWSDLSVGDKLTFFNLWHIVSGMGGRQERDTMDV